MELVDQQQNDAEERFNPLMLQVKFFSFESIKSTYFDPKREVAKLSLN